MIVNFPLNALVAWALFRSLGTVPLWGDQSIAGDTIVTSFLLPFITCLIVTRVARGAVRNGHVAPLGWTRSTHPVLRMLPRHTVLRGVLVGVVCAVTVGPMAVVAFGTAGFVSLSLWSFVALKGAYAALLGAFVTPLLALWAIAEPSPQ